MKYVLLLLIVMLPEMATSQSRAFDCMGQDPLALTYAQTIIAKVQEEYSRTKVLEGSFFQDSFNAALEISEVATGRFYFSTSGKMKWEYETPKKQVFLMRDRTVWFYQEDEKQLLIDNYDKVLVSDIPLSFLLGIGNLEKDFVVVSACKTPDGSVIELKPASSKSESLSGFKLLISSSSYFPAGASVVDAGGNVTSILLNGVEAKSSFSESTFETKFPGGIDVQDKRGDKKNGLVH